MPIYTGGGDHGKTGLFNNERVPKDDLRIAAYGAVDEVNSFVGLLRAEVLPGDLDAANKEIQDTLFELGADLATPDKAAPAPRVLEGIRKLEQWIDASEAQLPALQSFVLPGGCRAAGLCHVLRTTVRRAERHFWSLRARDEVPEAGGVYLNRLSDLYFSWARLCNQAAGVDDVPWAGTDR